MQEENSDYEIEMHEQEILEEAKYQEFLENNTILSTEEKLVNLNNGKTRAGYTVRVSIKVGYNKHLGLSIYTRVYSTSDRALMKSMSGQAIAGATSYSYYTNAFVPQSALNTYTDMGMYYKSGTRVYCSTKGTVTGLNCGGTYGIGTWVTIP